MQTEESSLKERMAFDGKVFDELCPQSASDSRRIVDKIDKSAFFQVTAIADCQLSTIDAISMVNRSLQQFDQRSVARFN